MEEKRGIKIYDYLIEEDRKKVILLFESLAKTRNLVPIIGAGFTSGMRTRDGKVPSADDLQTKIVSIICAIDHSESNEFKGISLTDISDTFWEVLESTSNPRYMQSFQEYIEQNFTNVYDMEQSKRHFLNSNWRTIYTLNYDDAIENILDIDKAIPYDKFNSRPEKNCLIKLHGDAKRFIMTGDPKYCVLGNRQYVSLIKDKSNQDLVNALESTFFSKSLFFVGCGLNNELDLLFSAGTQFEQKANLNKEHHIIYLLYDNGNKEINPLLYKKYGITDIIKVSPDMINELYESIYNISKKEIELHKKDTLKDYTDIEFEYLDKRNKENLAYLFYNDRININEGIIKLPAFFIERECGSRIERAILNNTETISVIFGTRFSGKTYVLIQLLKNITSKKAYYFPSNISLEDSILRSLVEKEKTIFLIDDKAITFDQYKNILIPLLEEFEKKEIKIVLTVNKGDVEFYRYYKNYKERGDNNTKFYELNNKFMQEESREFNEKIGDLSLIPYNENDTILDFLYRADDKILKNDHKSILPKINFLSNDSEKRVRALIILTTRGFVTSHVAIDLGIDDILYELVNDFSVTVQKDYLSDLEHNENAYSGFKFVLNSTYWAIKCLSSFASNSYNHPTIVQAYCNIVNSYSNLDKKEMNKHIKAYYMLDKIQLLFSNQDKKGTIRLPYLIYEGLHSILSWNFQFLHQEAKCELRMARRETNNDKKKSILELSYMNIGRAIELTEKAKSEKIEYTRAHMNVTKAFILINYVFTGEREQVSNTISTCYDAFVTGGNLCPQLEKDEMKDVKRFIENNLNECFEGNKETKDKFDRLYTEYMRKPNWVVAVN